MANIPKRLYTGQPTDTVSTLYTVPLNKKAIVKNIILCNTGVSDTKVTLYFTPSGMEAAPDNCVVSNYMVTHGDTVVIDLAGVLEAGDMIKGLQDTGGAITVYASGIEVG
jgi:hypothetical protein